VLYWDIVDAVVVGRLNAHTKVSAGHFHEPPPMCVGYM
jgi:hypothetical protein